MRRSASASEIINDLEMRIANLEKSSMEDLSQEDISVLISMVEILHYHSPLWMFNTDGNINLKKRFSDFLKRANGPHKKALTDYSREVKQANKKLQRILEASAGIEGIIK